MGRTPQADGFASPVATSTSSPHPEVLDGAGATSAVASVSPAAASGPASAGRILARAFTPSISDVFFVALILWLFVYGASGWIALLGDGDTGYHIRTGQWILETHRVPTHDLFSFSRPAAPWFAWEWLTDVIYALAFGAAGLKGIVLLAGAMIAATATLVLRYTLWRGANPLVAAFTTLLSVGASSMHFLARPHLFTLLLLPLSLWIVEADRRKRTAWLWALVPMTALWTNLHGGFVIFLACVALLVAACVIEAALGKTRRSEIRRYGALLAGCSAASLANPYGVQLHVHIWQYLRADWIRDIVQEFQAPTFRSEGQLQFEALLVAGLIATGYLLRRRMLVEALWVLFLAHSSLTSVRHAPLYAMVAAPLIAGLISDGWESAVAGAKKTAAARILYELGADLAAGFRRTSLWPALLIAALAATGASSPWAGQWPRDFPSVMFPTAMVSRHADLIASGRLLTPDQWGDYIIYHFYPRQKVYVDGRSDFYGQQMGQEYIELLNASYGWKQILARRGFTVALLPVNWPLASILKLDREWRMVADDGQALLFERVSVPTVRN